jgi:DNA polymerase-3 subunit beta
LDTTVITSVPATITNPGSLALPGKRLHEIARELPGGDVHFSGTGNRVTITCDRSEFTLSASSTDSFPALPKLEDGNPVTLPIQVLSEAITKTSYAVAKDDYRPALNGALWKLGTEGFEMVATDGHRLARIRMPGITSAEPLEAIVAPKALNLLTKLASGDSVSIRFGGSQISFKLDSTVIFSRTIEGPYPPYEKVIPSGNDMELTIEREDLVSALRRMRIIANPATHQVKFSLEPGNMLVEAEYSDAGQAHEKLEADYSGDPVRIGFNGDFLRDILRNMDCQRVRVLLRNSTTAVIIRQEEAPEDVDYLALLMPVKLPGEGE